MSGNIKWHLKCPPHAKLHVSTSSKISEKPINSIFFAHEAWSWGNHIIMVPLRILMRFLDLHARTFKCQQIDKKNCSTTLILLRWRHGRWTLYEKYSLKIGETSALSWWSKLIQNAPFAINPPIQLHIVTPIKKNRRPPPPLSVIGPPLYKWLVTPSWIILLLLLYIDESKYYFEKKYVEYHNVHCALK